MPVNEGFDFQDINEKNRVFRSRPERRRVQVSSGFDMKLANIKQVNEDGFVNSLVYLKKQSNGSRAKPLVSVIGDSYVEAVQVKDDETFFFQLGNENPELDIYSFGFSGAPLSQYLIWAKYSSETYNNKFLIINIVGNDFDESLKKYKSAPGFHHYEKLSTKELELRRNNFTKRCNREHSIFIDILYCKIGPNSSLINYLLRNLAVQNTIQSLRVRFLEPPRAYVGNVPANVSLEREQDTYLAIDAFFRDLPVYSGLGPDQILFVMDGMRYETYLGEDSFPKAENSFFADMRRYFFKRSAELGYDYIDLHHVFKTHYQEHNQRFEFPFDGHWNKLGHQVVADAIQSSFFWEKVLEKGNN